MKRKRRYCAAGCVEVPRSLCQAVALAIRTEERRLVRTRLHVSMDGRVAMRAVAQSSSPSVDENEPWHGRPDRMEQLAREVAERIGAGSSLRATSGIASSGDAVHAEEAALKALGNVDAVAGSANSSDCPSLCVCLTRWPNAWDHARFDLISGWATDHPCDCASKSWRRPVPQTAEFLQS